MTIAILGALLLSIVGRIMAEEVRAWFGWVHKTLRRKAVERLPATCRDRYDEEWASAIEEIPGDLFKLIHSLGLLRASIGIRQACGADVVRSSETLIVLKSELSIVFKRALDIFFSILVLIALAPLFLLIAIGIKIESRGPVFYSSDRIGKKGLVFRCSYFRTMVYDAERKRAEMIYTNDRTSEQFKIGPRITRIGRFLRVYHLTELPQFFNVLRGEMSLVGPRPRVAGGVYKIGASPYLDCAPGLTGLWQVQHSSADCPVCIDELYSRNRSIWLDIKIILRTILMVFRDRG
jgi:lipopolysaccharide/colanic/teichoic acid biosynthesis glycosyltransferase